MPIKILCAQCRKIIYRFPYRIRPFNYCSAQCQMYFEYAHKTRNPQKITEAAHRAVKKFGFPSRRGKPTWSKGLTKDSHPGIRRISEAKKINNPMWHFPVRIKRAKSISKYYRTHPLPEEQLLYNELKKRKLSFVFQYPFGSYILDFAFLRKKFDIEIDNLNHWGKDRRHMAKKRDEWLKKHKWHILRFKKSNVVNDIHGCMKKIIRSL